MMAWRTARVLSLPFRASRMMSTKSADNFQFVRLSSTPSGVTTISMNRPDKLNAMGWGMWHELKAAFEVVNDDHNTRVVVLNGGSSRTFTAGMDLTVFGDMTADFRKNKCSGRARKQIRELVAFFQAVPNAAERCRVPVIAAVNGGCIGAGVDIITACDMVFASGDAKFCVKEIDLAITADVGTLQRLGAIVGPRQAADLALTAKVVGAEEAARIGLVNSVFSDVEALHSNVANIAEQIAAKSPLAVEGTKEALVYAREHPTDDGLQQVAMYNSAFLMSQDLDEAMTAMQEKRKPVYGVGKKADTHQPE